MDSQQVQNYFQVQNIYVNQNKEGNYILLETSPIKSMLDLIRLQTLFWYEGNGNNHYKIVVKLVRGDQVIIEDRQVFPMAVRKNQKRQTVTIKHGEQLLKNYKIGDQIQVYYNISEGNNESKLIIKSFEIYLIYHKKSLNKQQLPQENAGDFIENVNYHDNDHVIREILTSQLRENLVGVNIELDWNDQGWGNQKGEVLARLRRGDNVVNDYISLFGIAKHEREKVDKIVQANESFLKDYQPNDFVDIGYIVGGGGGHSLKIHSLKLSFKYNESSQVKQQDEEEIYDKEIEKWIIDSKSQQLVQIEQQEQQEMQQLNIKRKFQEQNTLENITCKICYSNIISRIFDCGHAVMCESCFNENQVQQCPICRYNGYPKKIYFV